jgi:hypothetical protein
VTNGPISQRRREALLALADGPGFDPSRVAFVTAYADRTAPAFKKTMASPAWGTFAWFASEPDNLVFLREGEIVLDRLVRIDP